MSSQRSDTLWASRRVRARYDDISEMTLYRWEHNPELGFPEPLRINGRKFWRERELLAWERTRACSDTTAVAGEVAGDEMEPEAQQAGPLAFDAQPKKNSAPNRRRKRDEQAQQPTGA